MRNILGFIFAGAAILIILGFNRTPAGEPGGIPPEVVARYLYSIVQTERALYTTHIVERMQDLNIVKATENWKDNGTLPLPVQMLRIAGEEIYGHGTGLEIRLASLRPIYDWNGPADDFERKGLELVAINPDSPYTGIVTKEGNRLFKAIYADRAVSKVCVDCHNTHPSSPKQDYHLHDVMGGLIISFPLP